MSTDILTLTEQPAGSVLLTKTMSQRIAEAVITRVEDGDVDPLDTLAKLSFLAQTVDAAIKGVRALALTEAERYEQKTFAAFGVEFQIKETGVKYDYSADDGWQTYQKQIEELRAEQKAIELILKEKKQCAKTSTTNVIVTLKK